MIVDATAPICACGRAKERVRAGERKPQGEWRCRHCFRAYQRAYHVRRKAGIPVEFKEIVDTPVEIAPKCQCGTLKTLKPSGDGKPAIWYCRECKSKRQRATYHARAAVQTGTDPGWRESRDYWYAVSKGLYRRAEQP